MKDTPFVSLAPNLYKIEVVNRTTSNKYRLRTQTNQLAPMANR